MKYLQIVGGVVQGAFLCAQDKAFWPDVIEVADDDQRYLAYVSKSQVGTETAERAWRDAELATMVWIRDRHRDQLEIGISTTLPAEQFTELLTYMQALRDWPQSEQFPASEHRPVAPAWIAEQIR